MGVDKNEYVVYGWKMPYNVTDPQGNELDLWDERFLPYTEGHPDSEYSLIRDGMSGEYCVFGEVLAEGDEYEGMDFIEIDFNNLQADELKAKFEEVFGFSPSGDPKVLAFSHYS